MSGEVKTELFRVGEGECFRVHSMPESFCADAETYVICEKHTLADIVRFLIDQAGGDKSDIQYLLDQE